ncbi:MAG TPA: sigma-54 dependent transcriptional regulator [Methylomirabilota bacterium]|jgi:DNA-binding NtrC family response regulator|nr:sigma-54 dependent transcriptional regulator [Methylomirabilota bacterium]
MKHRILIADDDESGRSGLAALLTVWGYEVQEAVDGKDALERASVFRPSIVIADMVMPVLDGIGLLKPLAAAVPEAAVILLTGHASIETAVSAMREGAYDYMTKPVDPRRLRVLVEKAVEKVQVNREVTVLRRQLRESRGLGTLLGASPAMQEIYRLIELAAPSPAPVLVLGETGTGKELVARTIHDMSQRAKGPFIAVNCSAIPETLLESELFGHEKGAFTGALARRPGYFELADGGTIFLDEIAEMSSNLQAKYLRVLQDGQVRRVGGHEEVQVDVRVICATNKDVVKAVQDGVFREDLYYRVNVLTIPLPALRRRGEDIPLLVDAFIAEFNDKYARQVRGLDEAALKLLGEHPWPGNVRELRNVIERAVVSCEDGLVTADCLPLAPLGTPAPDRANVVVLPVGTTLDDGERELILRTLQSVNNNKTRAAEILGTTPKTLHNKARRWRELQQAGAATR